MNPVGIDELHGRLERANQGRRLDRTDDETKRLELQIEKEFGASRKLAVYGSLAPGEPNHHVIAHLEGRWIEAQVHGDLLDRGWAAGLGFPALRWRPSAGAIDVQLLEANELGAHWSEIDRFEGSGYVRILVPYFCDGDFVGVTNVYELALGNEDEPPATGRLSRQAR